MPRRGSILWLGLLLGLWALGLAGCAGGTVQGQARTQVLEVRF